MNLRWNKWKISRQLLLLPLLTLLALPLPLHAQDTGYVRQVLDTLTSPFMGGRGYVNNGDLRAARYLAQEFSRLGAEPLQTDSRRPLQNYLQPFRLQVNTFPGDVAFVVNGETLTPGADYLVHQESGAANELTLEVANLPANALESVESLKKWMKREDVQQKAVLIRESALKDLTEQEKELLQAVKQNAIGAKAIIVAQEGELVWAVGRRQRPYPMVEVLEDSLPEDVKEVTLDIDAELQEQHIAKNVVAYVPGTQHPDSFIVFTAHYDHLGRMGRDTYFPGGNDNASGTALLLDLAQYYAENPQPYSVAFIGFAAEEAGLVGSQYFTQNPLIPLEQIRFLLNVDLIGSGEDGVMVVNATEHPEAFELLRTLNEERELLPAVKKRGPAANSDHYWFAEQGVPAFFFYLMGPYSHYHDIYDQDELTLAGYPGLFKLLTGFVEEVQEEQ